MGHKTTVTFTTCDSEKTVRGTNMIKADGETYDQLVQRAVRKVYGQACHWWQDSGLGLQYGQVVHGSNCITGRVRVDF